MRALHAAYLRRTATRRAAVARTYVSNHAANVPLLVADMAPRYDHTACCHLKTFPSVR